MDQVIQKQTQMILSLAKQNHMLAQTILNMQELRRQDISDLNTIHLKFSDTIAQLQRELDGVKSNRFKQLMPGKN